MSQKYPGGFITKTPTAPTSSAAPGIWTLDQAMQNQKAGNWPSPPSPYIEDWFSTYLYTGNSSTQTITNGINLSANGGLVWIKNRTGAISHALIDTARGGSQVLSSDTTSAQADYSPQGISAFNSSGFTVNGAATTINSSSYTYASWTFREQAKFFDIVTYTGNGTNPRNISHNLGSVPGCIIVKSTSAVGNWSVYHRGVSPINNNTLSLQSTAAASDGGQDLWGNGATVVVPTSTVFTVSNSLNTNGVTYVAYLFAHDAGGFGLTGTDNVISCGSFTLDGSNTAIVTLGYEPQWVMYKRTNAASNWAILDNMRGLTTSGVDASLRPNTSSAETNGQEGIYPTATGFGANTGLSSSGDSWIYIAIRRGPMKVPTVGTTVYGAVARAGTSANATVTTGSFPPDLTIIRGRDAGYSWRWGDRLRGTPAVLRSNLTNAELTGEADLSSFNMNGFSLTGTGASLSNSSGVNYINYAMGRAPGFFDEVCYTGTGANTTVTHNLGVVPELIIAKNRTTAGYGWITYAAALGATKFLQLNTTGAEGTVSTYWNNTTPTSSVFSVGTAGATNASAENFVAYLFATCAGVSKVGSYTGTGAAQTINCGFTAGSRFVLIKRADSTGDWYVWDSTRGIIPSNDPYLLLNTTDAETTGTDYVDTTNVGFDITSTAPAALNANGGTYIFLAIA